MRSCKAAIVRLIAFIACSTYASVFLPLSSLRTTFSDGPRQFIYDMTHFSTFSGSFRPSRLPRPQNIAASFEYSGTYFYKYHPHWPPFTPQNNRNSCQIADHLEIFNCILIIDNICLNVYLLFIENFNNANKFCLLKSLTTYVK